MQNSSLPVVNRVDFISNISVMPVMVGSAQCFAVVFVKEQIGSAAWTQDVVNQSGKGITTLAIYNALTYWMVS